MERMHMLSIVAWAVSGIACQTQERALVPFEFGWSPKTCSLSKDGKLLAVGGMDGFSDGPAGGWVLWESLTGKKIQLGRMEGGAAHTIALSADGRLLLAGGNAGARGGELRIFDAKTGQCLHLLAGPKHCLTKVAFAPDAKFALGLADDDVLWVWRVKDGAALAAYRFPSKEKRRAETWNWQSSTARGPRAEVEVTFETPIKALYQFAISPDGGMIAIVGGTNQVFVIEPLSGKVVHTQRLADINSALSVSFSPDGSLLAIGSGVDDPDAKRVCIEIWNVSKWRHQSSMRGHQHSVLCLAISPDNKTVLSGGTVDGLRAWDADTGKQKYQLYAPTKEEDETDVRDIAFLPGGSSFVAIAGLRPIQFWRTTTGKPAPLPKR
jgi:WD40 repeat protein